MKQVSVTFSVEEDYIPELFNILKDFPVELDISIRNVPVPVTTSPVSYLSPDKSSDKVEPSAVTLEKVIRDFFKRHSGYESYHIQHIRNYIVKKGYAPTSLSKTLKKMVDKGELENYERGYYTCFNY